MKNLREALKMFGSCQFGKKYKIAPIKPAISLPKTDNFNHVVSMDLTEFKMKNIWILRLIGNASHYSAAKLWIA